MGAQEKTISVILVNTGAAGAKTLLLRLATPAGSLVVALPSQATLTIT